MPLTSADAVLPVETGRRPTLASPASHVAGWFLRLPGNLTCWKQQA